MFAGYENFSTFFVDANDMAISDVGCNVACFPDKLRPRFQSPDPWFTSSACSGDFIVVAEFSELEGPVPRVSCNSSTGSSQDADVDINILRAQANGLLPL